MISHLIAAEWGVILVIVALLSPLYISLPVHVATGLRRHLWSRPGTTLWPPDQ